MEDFIIVKDSRGAHYVIDERVGQYPLTTKELADARKEEEPTELKLGI